MDYIRELRGVDAGEPRSAGRRAARAPRDSRRAIPDVVDKLVLFAPAYRPDQPSTPPAKPRPADRRRCACRPGMRLEHDRWRSTVACDDQIDPGIQRGHLADRDGLRPARLGLGACSTASCGCAPSAGAWGWNREYAAQVRAPTLILVGEQDFLLEPDRQLYADLTGTENRVLVEMECATHFAVWETTQYKFMHQASLEWLEQGTFRGNATGRFTVEANSATP